MPDSRALGESHNRSQAKAYSRANSIRVHASEWKFTPELVFEVDDTDVDVVVHLKIEAASRNQRQKVAMGELEWKVNMTIADQKFRVRLPLTRSQKHPRPGKVVLLRNLLGGVQTKVTCFELNSETPVWLNVGEDKTPTEISLAVGGN